MATNFFSVDLIRCDIDLNTRCSSGQLTDETNTTIAEGRWSLGHGSTPTPNTGPDSDQSSSNGYYLFLEASDVSVILLCHHTFVLINSRLFYHARQLSTVGLLVSLKLTLFVLFGMTKL